MIKRRNHYRVFLKSFDNISGFGESPAEALADFKEQVTGRAIEWTMQLLANDDANIAKGEAMVFYRYPSALAKIFDRYKRSIEENGQYYFDVWEQEYDQDRGEWINKKGDTWIPKYPIKL